MTRDRVQLAVVCVACTIIALFAQPATAQSFPADCKPVGNKTCQSVRVTDFQYKAQLCFNALRFPSEPEAAQHYFAEAQHSGVDCPATIWSFLRWADDEMRTASGGVPDPDFSVACPGEGSGPFPLRIAGFDVANYSLYDVTLHPSPFCQPQPVTRPAGAVHRWRDAICPDGYKMKSGAYPDRYCYRNDNQSELGKDLGCPVKNEGSCSVGNPINAGTGNKYQVEKDYTGTGPNPLSFQRFYNSHAGRERDSANGIHRFVFDQSAAPTFTFMDPGQWSGRKAVAADAIGVNWRHTYQRGIVVITTPAIRSATLYREDGRVLVFNKYNGSWVADADVDYTITDLPSGWEVTTPTDATEIYNALGQLVSIADRAGVTVTLSYDGTGRLDKVTDQFGRELDFGYAADPQPGVPWWSDNTVVNQITTVTDSSGNVYTYGYDPDGRLTTVTYPDNSVREYRYENGTYPFALTGIIDGNLNRYATFGYDGEGRANLSYHGQGAEIVERVDVTYTDTGTWSSDRYFSIANSAFVFGQGTAESYTRSTTFSRRLGVSRMDSSTRGSRTESRTYDARGNVERHTDLNGNTVYRTYNARNLETLRREAENDPLERDITTTWHPTYRLPDVITEPNRTTDYDYYPNGDIQRVTITSLNSSGTEDLSTDGNRTRVWNYQYNAYGQVTSIDGPRVDVADVTTLDYYDEPTCPTGNGKCGQLEFIIDAEGNRTDFNEYYADGRLKRMTDPNGLSTQYEYDNRRRLTRITLTDGATSRVTEYSYDNAGQLDLVTFPNGLILDYEWTSAHLLDYVEDNLGNRIDYEYDAHGNQTAEYSKDPAGVIRNALATTYDDFGFVDTVTSGTLASGNSITTDFDYDPLGNLDRIVDADSRITDYTVDALGRAHRITDALLNDTDYGFDTQDNVSLVTAPNGATTSLPHDGLGNLDEEVSPDRGAIDFDYDDAGNLKVKLDARGRQTLYEYDRLDRLTTVTLDSGATIVYEYDDVGSNARGRLRRITDSTGETSWTYNKFGDVTSKTQQIGTVSLTTDYHYSANGQLEWMRLPSGKVVHYGYNLFLPNSVTVDTQLILSGAEYEPFGPVRAWTWGNSMPNSRSYDTRGLLVGQTMLTDNRVLGYDSVGRLTTLDDGRPSPGFDYSKLIPSSGDYTHTILPYSNRLDTAPGPVAKDYDYDAAGNVTSDGIHSYGYDDRGRLVSVDAGVTATYQHNGQGQRVRKDSGGVTTLFVYDEAGNLLGEYDATGTPVLEHVWFNGAPVAVLDGASTYYVHTDHLGTPRVISDGATEIWHWLSTPFGTTAAEEDPDADLISFTYNLRFPGQYYDAETALHYNYFRTYDPSTGRYLESDPIGLDGGLNTYAYVDSNPLGYVDYYGLSSTIVLPRPIVVPRPFPVPAESVDPVLPIPKSDSVVPTWDDFARNMWPDPKQRQRCESLLRRIHNLQRKLDERWKKLESNPRELAERVSPTERLRESVRGHRKLINKDEQELRKREREYDKECRQMC